MKFRFMLIVVCLGTLTMEAGAARAVAKGVVGRAAVNGVGSRAVSRFPPLTAKQKEILRLDALAHLNKPTVPQSRPLTLQRYTTASQAAKDLKYGIRAESHMTNARPGPPLTAQHAQQKYGLFLAKPQVRETIRIETGFPLRAGKARGGMRGAGERTSDHKVPPGSLVRVTPLPGRK